MIGFMRMAMAIAAIVVASALAGPAEAADKNGVYKPLGPFCSQYLRVRELPDDQPLNPAIKRAYQYWILGFVTATNLLMPNTYNILGDAKMDAINLWLDKWCRNHPSKQMADGMNDFVIERIPYRLKVAPIPAE